MAVDATPSARVSSVGSPSSTPLSLTLSEKSPSGSPTDKDSNPVKESFHLLDLLQQVNNVATALAEFKYNHATHINDAGIKDLEVMIESLNLIHSDGQKQVGQVSTVKYLHKSYGLVKNSAKKRKAEDPMRKIQRGAVSGLREFVKKCKKEELEAIKKANSPPPPMLFYEEPGRSERGPPSPFNPRMLIDDFTGLPPQGANKWTRETLSLFVDNLTTSGQSRLPFLTKIINRGKCEYKDASSINKVYNKWKRTGVFRGVGRPNLMSVDEIGEATKKALKDRTNDSNTLKLKHMKQIIVKKKEEVTEADGLDPNSIKVVATAEWSKVAMTAAAATAGGVSFSKKKLLAKTASRYRSEHSLMCGYSYALTALTTMYLKGSRPSWMGDVRFDKLSASTLETIDMVKQAYGTDNVYPVNPNLALSTDDTIIFAFEGTIRNPEEDWDWKIIDKDNSNSGVRGDFEVSDDAENSGGLRLRLTFTFTASGLGAPPYISVSRLTADELLVEACPDRILAAKVPGLCNGGDDLHNNGFGWLVFLRADKKEPASTKSSKASEQRLSIANKKFMHYNDDVLIPFIKSIREALGWKPGEDTHWTLFGTIFRRWLHQCALLVILWNIFSLMGLMIAS